MKLAESAVMRAGQLRQLARNATQPIVATQLHDAADELERVARRLADVEAALRPFAECATPRVLDPHPCATRCWRVGGATNIRNGVCDECGRRARGDDEPATNGRTFIEGVYRRAAEALARDSKETP